jgi:crotonobetainyl-CoA:carnitine CoA-transferase CaiB-like acyl-CoA transferase
MYVGTFAATKGYVPPRRSNSAHPSIVPFQNFRAADGWLVVAAAKQKFWEQLCDVVGAPDLATDPRFATMAARNENRDELVPILEEIFAGRTVAEWLELLVPAGIPAAKVNSVEEALTDPQTAARGNVAEHEHPTLGTVRTLRTALRVTDGERVPARGPFRGEHTEEVLAELCGYSAERIAGLADAGVFGKPEILSRVSQA